MEKVLSNKLPTLRNQMMKKLMSFQSVLHRATFTKYMNIVINKNKSNVLKVNDELTKISTPTTQITKKISQPKKVKAKIDLNETMKTRAPTKKIIKIDEEPKLENWNLWVTFYFMKYNEIKEIYEVSPCGAPRNLFIIAPLELKTIVKKSIFRNIDAIGIPKNAILDDKIFSEWFKYFNSDEDFDTWMDVKPEHYIVGYLIHYAHRQTGNIKMKTIRDYTPFEDELLQNTAIQTLYNKYIDTELNMDAITLEEMILQKGNKNECWLNAIEQYYTKYPKIKSDRKSVMQIIGKNDISNGLTVMDVLPFFEKYKIPMKIFNCIDELVYYLPGTNREIPIFYAVQKNKHITVMNYNIKSLSHKKPKEITIPISNQYMIRDNKNTETKFIMISNINDLVEIIKNHDLKQLTLPMPFVEYLANEIPETKKKTFINCISKENNLILFYLELLKIGYDAKIAICAGTITSISLQFNKKNLIINIKLQTLDTHSYDGEILVDDVETYTNLNEAYTKMNSQIFNLKDISEYSTQDRDILNSHMTLVPSGYYDNIRDGVEIDIGKAFTHAFEKIDFVPKFTGFDIWKPYEGQKIEKLTLYKVVSEKNMFFHKKHSLCYGKFLKHFKNVIITAYKQPSFINKTNYGALVKELFETKISKDEKINKTLQKGIANVNFGLLGKKINKSQVSISFTTQNEAEKMLLTMGAKGRIIPLLNVDETRPYKYEENEFGLCIPTYIDDGKHADGVYILHITAEKNLNNGFRFIKELLLQNHNFKMYKAYNLLLENNIKIHSVKTDAFTIDKIELKKARKLLNFGPEIGQWRNSKSDKICYPTVEYNQIENEPILISHLKPQVRIIINNEWDTKSIIKEIETHKRVIIRGLVPGVGKSHAWIEMMRNNNGLVVCPTNKLCQNFTLLGLNAVTLCSFFKDLGFIGGASKNQVRKAFDHSEYNIILFDEIYFASIKNLTSIKQLCDAFPEKIIGATGDAMQLPSIEPISNVKDYDAYSDECINQLFTHEIFLSEPKRVSSAKDKKIILKLKKDIFNESIPISTILSIFPKTAEITNNKNLSLTNSTALAVSQIIRKSKGYKAEYIIGEFLTCKIHTVLKLQVLHTNYEYKIIDVQPTHIELIDMTENETFSVPLNKIRNNFIYSYCSTVASCQGSSVDEKYTIFDTKHYFCSRKLLWTAITRATSLKHIKIYDGPELVPELTSKDYMKYFQSKIVGYKRQDAKAGRKIDTKNYVDVKYLFSCINSKCCRCNDVFNFNAKSSNFTCNRKDNTLGHTVDNIEPMCINCNCSLSDNLT